MSVSTVRDLRLKSVPTHETSYNFTVIFTFKYSLRQVVGEIGKLRSLLKAENNRSVRLFTSTT